MRVLAPILLVLCFLMPLTGCVGTALEHVEQRTEQIQDQFAADMAEADRAYRAGEITREEYTDLVEQSRKLATAELEDLPGEAREIIQRNREGLEERGKTYGFTLLQLLLGLAGAGGIGAVGITAHSKRKPKEPVDSSSGFI